MPTTYSAYICQPTDISHTSIDLNSCLAQPVNYENKLVQRPTVIYISHSVNMSTRLKCSVTLTINMCQCQGLLSTKQDQQHINYLDPAIQDVWCSTHPTVTGDACDAAVHNCVDDASRSAGICQCHGTLSRIVQWRCTESHPKNILR